jgi:hypothetical protein
MIVADLSQLFELAFFLPRAPRFYPTECFDYPKLELPRLGMVCAGLSAELRNTG